MTKPKPNLQRINSALSQLHHSRSGQAVPESVTASGVLETTPALSVPTLDPHTIRPFPSSTDQAPAVELPFLPSATATTPRQITNPRLAMGILKELEKTVAIWEQELRRVTLEIQDIHLEGPVIEGWLESQPSEATRLPDDFLQQADLQALEAYINGVTTHGKPGAATPATLTGYRLCSLDAEGRVQCQPCPAEQVPLVSLAIARHQKLRQLLSRKVDLESRLTRLAETLITAHQQLEPDASVG